MSKPRHAWTSVSTVYGTDKPYWPGRDYPDREVWLKRRATNLRGRINRVIHQGDKPFVLGVNKLKRQLDAAARGIQPARSAPFVLSLNKLQNRRYDSAVSRRIPVRVFHPRQTLIRQRHAYYRRDDAQATPDAATAGDSASAS